MNDTFLAFHFILFGVSELVRALIGIHLDEHQVFSVSHKMSRKLTYYLSFFLDSINQKILSWKAFYCFLFVLYKK